MVRYYLGGRLFCQDCGAALDRASLIRRKPEDYCGKCGNLMEEIILFTSKTKHCKVCEVAGNKPPAKGELTFSNTEIDWSDLDELFKDLDDPNKP